MDDERCMWKIESGDRIMVRIYMSGAASWPLCVCYAIQPTPLPDGVDTVCSTRRDPVQDCPSSLVPSNHRSWPSVQPRHALVYATCSVFPTLYTLSV